MRGHSFPYENAQVEGELQALAHLAPILFPRLKYVPLAQAEHLAGSAAHTRPYQELHLPIYFTEREGRLKKLFGLSEASCRETCSALFSGPLLLPTPG